ncbi:hypothetical protein E4U43_005610 [Claviceps pusilla]|uniref:SRP40-suppressor of mutant AC40 of RNA polymerase I and III n=1 Tax=Claviceps pusilla TaxID=123648 RepID=A0A9P7NED7_9HYPO|nr:hypothetical protein E4U43_005610 [Claviceps pusilla]
MAPKGQYKVHSLSKHIEDTQRGLTADAQYNKRAGLKSAMAIKKEPGSIDKSIFGNDASDDSMSDDDSSSSGSSDEEGSDFLRKLAIKSGKAPNATPKKRSNDDEIADSDDERKAAAKKTEAGNKTQPIKREESSQDESSSSESESETDSESESEKSEKKVRADGASLKSEAASGNTSTSTSVSKPKDDENESDSSEDEEPEEKKPARLTAKNGSSAEEGKEEKVLEPVATPPSVSKVTNGNATTSTSDTSSSEEEGSDDEEEKVNTSPAKSSNKNAKQASSTESSSESSSEASDADEADESMHITDRKQHGRVALPDFIARDFVLRKSDDGAKGQDVARICSEANLQGKQVWYFTVPANVPISVVQNMEIPMNQSNRDDRVFSHDGEDYGISFDSMMPKSSIQILIPSADGAQYQSASHQINQVMHVKKVAQLGRGNLHTLSSGPAPQDPRRAQPKGMKIRYRPFGVNTPMGQIGGDDEESGSEADIDMVDAPSPAVPSRSATSKAEKKEKKQKQKKQDADTARKGKRKLSSEDDATAAAEQLMEESQSAKFQSKKQKTLRDVSPDLGSDEKGLSSSSSSSSSTTKKVTLVLPPEVPSSQRASSTPIPKWKNKNVKLETPVSAPRQSVVPIPVVPGSSQLPKVSPVPVPQPPSSASPLVSKDSKKVRVKREKTEKAAPVATIKQSPSPSAQGNKLTTKKVTPVPAPKLKSTS